VGLLGLLDDVDPGALARRWAELERHARALLSGGEEERDAVRIVRSAAMRYELQEWELRVRLPDALSFDADTPTVLADAFHIAHHARYGFSRPEKPVELVTLYLEAALRGDHAAYERPPGAADGPAGDAVVGEREVWTGAARGAAPVPVYDRARLGVGAALTAPCIVEEPSATTYLHPGWRAVVDAGGTLIATRSSNGSRR
jgi:N-methylhydantoinase A/oxoprolinase/acetone carboxylase beta subunit